MKKKRKGVTKKERMNKLLKETIERFKQDVVHDEEMLKSNLEFIKNTQVAIEELEVRIKQTKEVIEKLSK